MYGFLGGATCGCESKLEDDINKPNQSDKQVDIVLLSSVYLCGSPRGVSVQIKSWIKGDCGGGVFLEHCHLVDTACNLQKAESEGNIEVEK